MMRQRHIHQTRQRQERHQSKSGMVIFLLILLLIVSVIAYTALRLGNSGGQANTNGQCLSNGAQFNGRREAFQLAQLSEQYRAGYSYNGNYGYASYTLCYKDGTQQRRLSSVAPGFDNVKDKTKPLNYTHSEQALFRWASSQLTSISFDAGKLAGIYVIIFSQVRVCDACVQDMVSWQSQLRQVAKTSLLYLAIWDIRPGTPSAFIPTVSPAGTGTPVAIADLRRVTINFIP